MAPMLKIPPKAAFVLPFICRFQIKKTGKIPKVKSQNMVSALYRYAMARRISVDKHVPVFIGLMRNQK